MKKIVLVSALIALTISPALTLPADNSGYMARFATALKTLKTTITTMSWQKKLLVAFLSTVIAKITTQKIASYFKEPTAVTDDLDMLFSPHKEIPQEKEIKEAAVANESLDTIIDDAENLQKIATNCSNLTAEIVKKYILAMAKQELKTGKKATGEFYEIIKKYLGFSPMKNYSSAARNNLTLHVFDLEKMPAVRSYWGSAQGFNNDKFQEKIAISYKQYQKNGKLYDVIKDEKITDDTSLKAQIANIYKIHIMPPSENVTFEQLNNPKIPQSFLDTDLEAAADIVMTVLTLLKENKTFRESVFAFKFVSALSIPRKSGDVYPFIVLYFKPNKELVQQAADLLYKELVIKKKNSNHVYLTPRSNQQFRKEKPIYYILGDGQARTYKATYGPWVNMVYDGPFFQESFIGVSKEDQMLTVPKE